MALIHTVWITSWMILWMCMHCSGTESPELSTSNEYTTEAGAQVPTTAPAATATPCRNNGSVTYCGELDTPGPHCMDCLRALWEEIGCTPEGIMSPDLAPPNVDFWNGVTVQQVKVDIDNYKNHQVACSGPDKPETTTQDQNTNIITGTTPVDSPISSAGELRTSLTSPESTLLPSESTGPVLTDSPGQPETADSGTGSQSLHIDQQTTTVAPTDISVAGKTVEPINVTPADSSPTSRAPSGGTGTAQVANQPASGGSSDSVTLSYSRDRTESKPKVVPTKAEEDGNRTTGQAHTATAGTAQAVSTGASRQRGIPRVLLYAVLAVIALVLIMISVAVYCEYTRRRKRENKKDRQPQASLQNASDETGAEAGSQTELHTSGSFRGKHRESIPIKDLSPIKAEYTETPNDNVV